MDGFCLVAKTMMVFLLKKVDMNTLNRMAKVNRVIELIETKNITQINNLIKDAGAWVADQLGLKKYEGGKKVDMNTLNRTAKVNRVIELIETKNITQINNLIKAAGFWVADQLGLKKYEGGKKKDPWWKRRIEEDIKQLKKRYQHSRKGKERENWCTQR